MSTYYNTASHNLHLADASVHWPLRHWHLMDATPMLLPRWLAGLPNPYVYTAQGLMAHDWAGQGWWKV